MRSDASPAATADALESSKDEEGDARRPTTDDVHRKIARDNRLWFRAPPRSSDAAASPREDDRADVRRRRARTVGSAAMRDPGSQDTAKAIAGTWPGISQPVVPPSDVQKADSRPWDAGKDSAGADVRPADGTTRRDALSDVNDGRVDRQRGRQLQDNVRTTTLTRNRWAGMDHGQDAAEIKGRDQRQGPAVSRK